MLWSGAHSVDSSRGPEHGGLGRGAVRPAKPLRQWIAAKASMRHVYFALVVFVCAMVMACLYLDRSLSQDAGQGLAVERAFERVSAEVDALRQAAAAVGVVERAAPSRGTRSETAAPGSLLGAIDNVSAAAKGARLDIATAQSDARQLLRRSAYVLVAVMLSLAAAALIFARVIGRVAGRSRDLLLRTHRVANRSRAARKALRQDLGTLNGELLEKMQKLKEANEELLRKGKLAQLGQLTATVAHEIRNPLAAIRTSIFLIECKIKGNDPGIRPLMDRITTSVNRCDKIISELLDFTRTRSLNHKSFCVDAWVKATVEEELLGLPAIVKMSYDLTLGSTEASFDEDRIRRVIINFLSNAFEAMVGKGDKTAGVVSASPRIAVSTRCIGDNIEIAVTDNGPGISEENLKKIMEPLFTTKSFGVGLGLPAVDRILQQHGGGLRIESQLGAGATFTAWFPRRPAEQLAA